MEFLVIPAVHYDGGAFPDYPAGGAPQAALTALAREHGEAYVIDQAGVRRNQPDLDFAREATRLRPVWLDTGARTAMDAMDALVAGARRVTVRWSLLKSTAELDELADLTDAGSIYLSLDHGDKGFTPNPRDRAVPLEGAARAARERGFGLVVRALRYDAALAQRIGSEGERWWLGPVTRDEALDLKRLEFAGVIVPAAGTHLVGKFEAPKPDVPAEGAGDAP